REELSSTRGSPRARDYHDAIRVPLTRRPRPWSNMERVTTPARLRISRTVKEAIAAHRPVVALESTVITHGLPRPRNLEAGLRLEEVITTAGALPATIGVIKGDVVVGMNRDEL